MFHHVRGIMVLVVGIALVGMSAFFYFSQSIKKSTTQSISEASVGTNDFSSVQGQIVPVSEMLFVVDKNVSEASFTIKEDLRGSSFSVIGTTSEVNGDIRIDFTDPSRSRVGDITIDARTFHTDSQSRDSAIIKYILHSEDAGKEFVVFTPKKILGLPKAFAAGIPLNLTLIGDLTISGITHSVSFNTTNVVVSPDAVSGDIRAVLKRSDYGLTIPNIPFVANVLNEFTIALRLNAKLKH